jgi:gliding motility-associated-like protein
MLNQLFTKTKRFVAPILLVFLASQGFAQGYNTTNWRFSNPTQMGITFFDVDYFDDNNVIAVGAAGGIAKSTDGGRNWRYGPFTYNDPAGLRIVATLNDVHYITSTIAYTVGDRGCMAKSTDGGQNWSFLTTPLYANSRNINAVWFINKDTGYIGGQFNSIDSVPKLYITRNGGSTWDSIAAPVSVGRSRVGYFNNVNIPSVLVNLDSKAKDIYRIEFINDSVGYVCGSASSLFPRASESANGTTCLPNGGSLTGSASNGALLWKIVKNVPTDFSLSKERLGYTGINTSTPTCTSSYNSAGVTPVGQTYRAMNILNDTTVVLMSFNNNCVVRVGTGRNDSTANVNNAGSFEKGRYTILNFPFPPSGGPNAGPPIPPVQVLLASNPYQIKRAANGKLYAGGNFGRVWTSTDNGANWREERSYPPNQNFSQAASWALDIAPNGRFLFMGTNGAVADSTPGGSLFSNYNLVAPGGGYAKFDFVDCNTGIGVGGAAITRTLDGGKTWLDNNRPDFGNGISITGLSYPRPTKAYLSVNNGILYRSDNANASQAAFVLDPIYTNLNYQMNDVVAVGNDTVYCLAYSAFSVPTANRKSTIFRSFNNGVSWQAIDIAVTTTTPAFTAPTLSQLAFPSRNIGYAAGSRNGIYKTTDGGTTWTSINPFPAINQFPSGFPFTAITYTEIMALDDNVVFAVGNMFTSTGIKRVYKTIDGGVNWIDITANIPALFPVGNVTGVLFHDANNGYVTIGSTIFKTTDGGANWTIDISPTGIIGQTMAFAPRTVPAGISMVNRKMFFAGFSGPGGASNNIMEYGNPADINVNVSETIVGSCSNGSNGTLTVSASGGIAPYSYSLSGGAFQSSNIFTNLTSGPKTLVVRDAFCGLTTKNVTITSRPVAPVNAGPDFTIVDGDVIALNGTGTANTSSIAWTPNTQIVSGANAYTALVKPNVTTNYLLTVTDNQNCVATDNALVTVIPFCVNVKKAFSPNGDGINDRWLVTNGAPCFKQILVKVYNRYGELVYSNDNYNNTWDGTYKGKPLPDATYYYNIVVRLINDQNMPLNGDVTILR